MGFCNSKMETLSESLIFKCRKCNLNIKSLQYSRYLKK